MDHQPDVQQQQQPPPHHHHHQQQNLQESANVVYVNPQNFQSRNQQFVNNHQSNQTFQQQNANFGQFENSYSYFGNGHFSSSNAPTAVIPNAYSKAKNAPFRNTQFVAENGHENYHRIEEPSSDYNYQPNLNYQQPPQQFFVRQNVVENQYQMNDMLVPTCQSSGSSEASDDSSISNASHHQPYANDTNAFQNPHLEFTVPIPLNQSRYHQYQQKDFGDNYMTVMQQDVQRCDSSKSETAESTCSSLSSGSNESQSDDNMVRLPVLVNPNGNGNMMAYQSNTHNSINTYQNQIHHNQYDLIDQQSRSDPTKVKLTNRCPNNLVVMFPNRLTGKNCLTTNQIVPSSSDVSKIIQNQRLHQRNHNSKLLGLISVPNQTSHDRINHQMIKLNDNSDDSANNSYTGNSVSSTDSNKNGDNLLIDDNTASHIQNTSDSSVINSNFVQTNISTNIIDGNKNDCAILLKETSDKCISPCVSDVNSSMVNSNNVYLVKTNQSDLIDDKDNNCYDSSGNPCHRTCSNGNNVLPVPVGWRRLLVDGSVIYLSPSNIALSSIEQVKIYLQTMGTCKCGLECPVNCDSVFNFNPKVISRPWDSSDSELTKLCNHKRKAAMIGMESSEAAPDKNIQLDRKEVIPTKRKKKRHGSSYSGVSVSQLLAQRDRALAAAAASRWPSNVQPGNVDYQSIPGNQYQNIQVLQGQPQEPQQIAYETNQGLDSFKQVPPPPRLPDKTIQYPCVNVVNNTLREDNSVNMNDANQLITNENHPGGMIRNGQMNLNAQAQNQGMIAPTVNYNQNQEFMHNIAPRPEGVVLTPQGMLFPPNMIMQRPRSIPPWHQSRLGMNKKQTMVQGPVMYERVPSLQQHMPPPALVFEDVTTRKKHKSSSKIKKRSHDTTQNQPSFMDDPNAYLAQQTALLHNTISRPNFNPDSRPMDNTNFGNQGVPLPSNVLLHSSKPNFRPMNQKLVQNDFNQRNILEQRNSMNNAPNQNFNHVCSNVNCHDCGNMYENPNEKIRLIQENLEKSNMEVFNQSIYGKCDWRRTSVDERPEENPVTSSTEKKSSVPNQKIISDTRPIQGGTISTSNDSPQPQTSPNSFRQDNPSPRGSELTSLPSQSPVTGNVLISSSTNSPFAVPNNVYSPFQRDNDGTPIHYKNESSPKVNNSPSRSYDNFPSVSPESSQKYKFDSQKYQNFETDQIKSSVSSTYDMQKEEENDNKGNRFVRTMASGHTVSSNTITSVLAGKAQTATVTVNNNTSSSSSSGNVNNSNNNNDKDDDNTTRNNNSTNNSNSNRINSGIHNNDNGISSNSIVNNSSNNNNNNNIINSNIINNISSGISNLNRNNNLTPTTTSTAATVSVVNFTNPINIPIVQKVKSPLEMVQSVVSGIQTSTPVVSNEIQPNIVSVSKTVLPSSNVISSILTNTTNVNTTPIITNTNTSTQVLKPSTNLPTGHILVSSNGQYIVASNSNIIPQSSLKLNQTSPMPPLSASPVVTNVTGAVTQVLPAVGVAQQVLGQPTVLVNTLPAPFVIQPGVMAVDTGLGHLAVAGNVLQSNLIENDALRNSNLRGLISPDKTKNKKGSKKRKNQVASIVQMTSPNNVILNQGFNQQNFAVSPGGSIQPLQALTLVSNKHGGPTQIVMNNQNNFNQFNSQQINLLQPVNLASVQNFPAFQQFIVPSLGNMVMSTDGTTAILPDTNIGVQLQLQNVNGQNVLTPVQNTGFINSQGILTTTPAGMLIRAPNNQQKIIQNNSNPQFLSSNNGQFLSPNNGQFLVNQFQGQLSPLITTNLSPNQQIFTNSPPRQSPQEFIQIIPTSNAQNTTVVQQNTTIVQQQTTMVSNNQNLLNNNKSNFILNNTNLDKPIELQIVANPPQPPAPPPPPPPPQNQRNPPQEKVDIGTQHSVSTQTIVNKDVNNSVIATNNTFCQTMASNWSGSPPDTTTHSPIDSDSGREREQTPSGDLNSDDCLPQAMVQYVSSSINENDGENDAYLLPGIPNLLNRYDGLSRIGDKGKPIVESSTILQDSGIQIQIGSSYMHQKSTIDESVVSSHTDIGLQDKHIESQSTNSEFQNEKGRHTDSILTEGGHNNYDDEEKDKEPKEKLMEGDLVWGSARGSPAWPGKLVGPISPGGKAWVRWFGGHVSSPTRVSVSQLQSLSQGLEAHHKASNKGRKNRKLNIELEAAIQEAMLELDKITAQQKKITANNGRPRRSHR